ncbi:MAG: bifunctional NADH-specific enoyl-ACP reductase/trans-2-enoyl-CoA reductase, partial [Vibrio sp.]
KASVFIPGLSPYLIALYQVMKNKGTHEGCIEQMQRLLSEKLYGRNPLPVDSERLIRMDDWEMNPDTQAQVAACLAQLNASNFQQLGDYTGFKQEFMQLNGFGFTEIDYQQPVNLSAFINQNDPNLL